MKLLQVLGLSSVLLGNALAFAYVEVGGEIPNPELTRLAGGTRPFLGAAPATVFVFFDPTATRSREVLQELVALQAQSNPAVEWLGVVSDRLPAAQVEEALAATGSRLTVLIDAGDRLYGELGVRLQPSVGIADGQRLLRAYLPYEKLNYQVTIRAHLRHTLGEISAAELEAALAGEKIELNGDRAQAERQVKLAEMLLGAGKTAPALAAAQKAIALAPDLAGGHAVAGAAQATAGDCVAARASLERALVLEPENRRAKDALALCP